MRNRPSGQFFLRKITHRRMKKFIVKAQRFLL